MSIKYTITGIIGGALLLMGGCRSTRNYTVDVTPISYDAKIRKIVKSYCVSCHSGSRPAAGFRLTTYEEVRLQAEKGNLLSRINDITYPMPVSGLMPKETRKVIEDWAKNGYLESADASTSTGQQPEYVFSPPVIDHINLDKEGFEFFDLMSGHWVGKMEIMNQKLEWFSFDYRPISATQVHGIYEGGNIGNLFTSFFITNFKGRKTIMARNGGVLNGIYRVSYFVLDKVEIGRNRKYFRLVDAYGGKDIMWMELEFIEDRLRFNSYTSKFGLNGSPTKHMKFEATRKHREVSAQVADQLGYPRNEVEIDFSEGLPKPDWGEFKSITSATYTSEIASSDIEALGKLAGDPITISQVPHVASLTVGINQNKETADENIIIYLSKESLTDKSGKIIMKDGYIRPDLFDGVFMFPDIAPNKEEFTFTYLHPGEYFVTVVADKNKDGYISKGDITHVSKEIIVTPRSTSRIEIDQIDVSN